MQGFIKLLVIVGLAYGAYYSYNEFFGSDARELEGTWRSNKEASLREAERAGISAQRLALFGRLYGKMTYEIEDGVWSAVMDGEDFGGPFEVLSKTGDCYAILTDEGEGEVCIRDGQLYVYSEMSKSYEVFDRL